MSKPPIPQPLADAIRNLQRLIDSRIDTVGDAEKPKSLVETFWLNETAKSLAALEAFAEKDVNDDGLTIAYMLGRKQAEKEGMTLPVLPENIQVLRLCEPSKDRWRCQLTMSFKEEDGIHFKWVDLPETHYGKPTPRAAVIAAMAQIPKQDGGK